MTHAWRTQRRNRATPLLMVVETEDGLSALGPEGTHPVPQRVAPAFLDALEVLVERGGLEATVEQLAAAIVVHAEDVHAPPGLRAAGLFTPHFLFRRLPRTAAWASLEDLAPASIPRSWRELVSELGYSLREVDDGYLAVAGGEEIAVVRAHDAPRALDAPIEDLDDLPYRRLGELMRRHRLGVGLLVADSTLRLFALEGAARLPDRYLELRLDRMEPGERPYLGVLAPATLGAEPGLNRLLADARHYGAELKGTVEQQIRDVALPTLVRGLLPFTGEDPADPEVRREVSDAAMTLLFRLVFLLFAESADYLPVRSDRYEAHSLGRLAREARQASPEGLDTHASGLWDGVRSLVNAIRTGNATWGVPAYNGGLFSPDDFPGADLLERASLSDADLGPALTTLAYDPGEPGDDPPGIDWAGLGVAHIGSIYEGLLHLRLAYAEQHLAYDAANDRYELAGPGDPVAQPAGSCFLVSERGGRKAGGVYYTQELFVQHLIEGAVGPPLSEHLARVRELGNEDADAAAVQLLDFAVIDPAMGSGHFLVGALDYLAAEVGAFLREVPLPAIDERIEVLRRAAVVGDALPPTDRQLLRRLLVKHSIFGVDRSAMAVELAKISLWLSSFVPGLPLSVLDANLRHGDSLIGVDRIGRVLDRVGVLAPLIEGPLQEAVREVAAAAARQDTTLDEIGDTEAAIHAAERAAEPARRLLDAYTAIAFGVDGASDLIDDDAKARSILSGLELRNNGAAGEVAELRARLDFLHWPLAFPRVFARENPGFDAVVGNPPWNEINVERTGFFVQHDPGLGAIRSPEQREKRIDALIERFPELESQYDAAVEENRRFQAFIHSPHGDYALQGSGNLDLYELFCERYGTLLRLGGGLGVVLPRSALYVAGTVGFRRWLFDTAPPRRVDVLLNSGRWAFDMEPRYTVALVTARVQPPSPDSLLNLSGPHPNRRAFEEQRVGVPVALGALGRWTRPTLGGRAGPPTWEVPLLPSLAARDLYDALMTLPRFDEGGSGDWRAHAFQGDFNVTTDRQYIRMGGDWDVWTGGTFEQYSPWFGDAAGSCDAQVGCERLERKRRRSGVWQRVWPEAIGDPARLPARTYRVAFRDVTNRTNARTVIACLVPPQTFLTNTAPYLILPDGGRPAEAYLLGVMNSLVFNWLARRMVELHVNFFVLNLLRVPDARLDSAPARAIIQPAARLQAVHKVYAPWGRELGISCGPLEEAEREALRLSVETAVLRAYGLEAQDLDVILEDFSERAVPVSQRRALREALG